MLALLGLTACAASQTEAPKAPPAKLVGVGTEPFWNFTLEHGTFRYTTPDAPAPRSAEVTQRSAGDAIELDGRFAGQPLRARIRFAPCSDGMSDRRYPMEVELTIEGRLLAGCAYRTDMPPPAEQR